jgi:AcrR family transcriptional regulator
MAAPSRPGAVSRTLARSRPAAQEDGAGLSHAQITEIQRSRLLTGAVKAIEELGYTRATVAHITRRARVSRRTFYELFANRDECLASVIESVVDDLREELDRAGIDRLPWRERIRTGLWTVLCFLDREPALARVCVVQSLRGGQCVLERREEIVGALASAVDEGRTEGARGGECPPLTAEGLVGAGLAIVYARLLREGRQPLTGLLGELMGMIVLPYMGPAAARREQTRALPALPSGNGAQRAPRTVTGECDPLESLNMRLTYRTARVLEAIVASPGISNRAVGEGAGVTDQGQISKLLARLERLGLIANAGERHAKGEPNAWTLTASGAEVAQSIRNHARHDHNEGMVS